MATWKPVLIISSHPRVSSPRFASPFSSHYQLECTALYSIQHACSKHWREMTWRKWKLGCDPCPPRPPRPRRPLEAWTLPIIKVMFGCGALHPHTFKLTLAPDTHPYHHSLPPQSLIPSIIVAIISYSLPNSCLPSRLSCLFLFLVAIYYSPHVLPPESLNAVEYSYQS